MWTLAHVATRFVFGPPMEAQRALCGRGITTLSSAARHARPSAARHIRPGPRPLRSLDFPYGFLKSELTPQQTEHVRLGTYFALQSARFLREAHGLGVGFAIETIELRSGAVSVFTLPEFDSLSGLVG